MSNPIGRPPIIVGDVLNKLEEVFAIGGSDKEACFYADISHQTLYDYQHTHPEFVERKEALKNKPILKARQEVVKGLKDDPEFSLKYLERKLKDEFSVKTESKVDMTLDAKIDLRTASDEELEALIK